MKNTKKKSTAVALVIPGAEKVFLPRLRSASPKAFQVISGKEVVTDLAEVESQDENASESEEPVVGDIVLQRQRMEEEVEDLRGAILGPGDGDTDVALEQRSVLATSLRVLGIFACVWHLCVRLASLLVFGIFACVWHLCVRLSSLRAFCIVQMGALYLFRGTKW